MLSPMMLKLRLRALKFRQNRWQRTCWEWRIRKTGAMQLQLLVEANARLSADDIASHRIAIRQHVLDTHDLLITNIIPVRTKGSIEKTSSGKKRRKVIRQRLAELSRFPMLPHGDGLAPVSEYKRLFNNNQFRVSVRRHDHQPGL